MDDCPLPFFGRFLWVHSTAPLSTSGAAQMLPILADLLNSILNIE
jgi:hypothetical protein